ncbi:MAG TPA: formate dehydrogenase subunit gamma [Terriglobales bacterium]
MSSGTITRAGTQAPEEQIVRYSFDERANHWINALSYSYCLFTGLALFTPFLYWLAAVLGGGATIRFWHPWVGLVYVASIFWMYSGWKSYMVPIPEDAQWRKSMKYYVTNRDDRVPPQGRFNAGQKLFWKVMFWCTFILVITGIVMWFPEKMPRGAHFLLPITVFIHSATALVTIAAFIIHVYMSVWMTPGSMKAMIDGSVSSRWARAHHRLWYEKVTGRKS